MVPVETKGFKYCHADEGLVKNMSNNDSLNQVNHLTEQSGDLCIGYREIAQARAREVADLDASGIASARGERADSLFESDQTRMALMGMTNAGYEVVSVYAMGMYTHVIGMSDDDRYVCGKFVLWDGVKKMQWCNGRYTRTLGDALSELPYGAREVA